MLKILRFLGVVVVVILVVGAVDIVVAGDAASGVLTLTGVLADSQGSTRSDISPCQDVQIPYSLFFIGVEKAHSLDSQPGVETFLLGQPFFHDHVDFWSSWTL